MSGNPFKIGEEVDGDYKIERTTTSFLDIDSSKLKWRTVGIGLDVLTLDKIMYADEEYDQPIVHIAVRVGGNFNNDLYIDCTPSGTYHIGGSELDIIAETIFDLVSDGLLEK